MKLQKLDRKDPTVMPAAKVFEMATIDGARALGIADRVGSLEAGKLADVVIVDVRVPALTPLYDPYSHLVYAVKGGDVATTIVNGRIVFHDDKVSPWTKRACWRKQESFRRGF